MDYNRAKYALREICKEGGSGDEKEVKKILDEHPSLINQRLDSDYPVLVYASINNHLKVIKLLLSYQEININKQNGSEDSTALHWASFCGHKEIVELLLSHPDIDINIKVNDGKTALHCASQGGHKDIVELLLSHPCIDSNIKNNDRQLASDVCCDLSEDKSNKPIILELLKNHSEAKTALISVTTITPFFAFLTKFSASYLNPLMWNYSHLMKNRIIIRTMSLLTAVGLITISYSQTFGIGWNPITIPTVKWLAIIGLFLMAFGFLVDNQRKGKEKYPQKRFDDDKRSLVMKPLPLPPNKQTHVFLTHTWRKDEKGRNNHDRVGRVNEALRKRGLVTWFDSERLEDKIQTTIAKALYSTCCVLIFVTREYEKKVNSANDRDYCFYEFNIAATDNDLANMRIPIVMDESMLNPDSWDKGLLKAGVGGKMFVDVSSDDKDVFEERCNEVFERVVKLLKI